MCLTLLTVRQMRRLSSLSSLRRLLIGSTRLLFQPWQHGNETVLVYNHFVFMMHYRLYESGKVKYTVQKSQAPLKFIPKRMQKSTLLTVMISVEQIIVFHFFLCYSIHQYVRSTHYTNLLQMNEFKPAILSKY